MGKITWIINVCCLCLCVMSCSQKQADDVDFKRFEGKTVGELLEYLHTQYGCYTKYYIIPDIATGTLTHYNFLYYDSAEVKKIWVEIDPPHLRYVPRYVPIREFNKPTDYLFPLYLYKKEIIDNVGMQVIPLKEWLQYEIYLDSLEYIGIKMGIEEESQ